MSPKVRFYAGILTTFVFLAVGAMLIVEQRMALGLLVMGLGVVRGLLAIRQSRTG